MKRNACSAGLGGSRIQAALYNSLKKRKSSDNFDLKKILPYMTNLSLGLKESGRVWGRQGGYARHCNAVEQFMFISDRNRSMVCSSYLAMAYAKLCNTTTIRMLRDANMETKKNQTKRSP